MTEKVVLASESLFQPANSCEAPVRWSKYTTSGHLKIFGRILGPNINSSKKLLEMLLISNKFQGLLVYSMLKIMVQGLQITYFREVADILFVSY